MAYSRRFLIVLMSVVVALCLAPQMALAADSASVSTSGNLAAGSATSTVEAQAVKPVIAYKAYTSGSGWTKGWKKNGKTAGISGKRIQAVKLKLNTGGIMYRTNMYRKGWQKWSANGAGNGATGTTMMGIQIKLTGKLAKTYDVMYRVNHAVHGWLPWVCNGATAGCLGSYGVNQIQVKLVKKGATPKIKDGAYLISVSSNGKQVLASPTVATTGTQRLTRAIYDHTAVNERFYVRNESNGTISIQSVATGKFLYAAGGKVVLGTDSSALSHRWKLKLWNSGFAVVNAATGKRLCMAKGKAAVGTVKMRWNFSSVGLIGDGNYTVTNKAHGNVLNLVGASFDNNANINVAKSQKSSKGAQTFAITAKGANVYRIDNALTFKPIEVAGGKTSNGANVQQAKWKSANKQKWQITLARDGGLVFKNVASGKILTAKASGKVNGNVVSSADTGAACQRWALKHSNFVSNIGVSRCVAKAQNASSSTKYLIAVDLTNHWLVIFRGSSGNWTIDRDWIVSNGKASTPTVTGSFTVGSKTFSFGHGYTCYYATQFYGDYLFHSVKYHEGTYRISDGRLGEGVSMGCVRMEIENAKWIYNNIPAGTRVITFK